MTGSDVKLSDVPVWNTKNELSYEWLSAKTGLDVKSCVSNLEGGEHKGFSGAKLIKLNVTLENGEQLKLVIK